MDEVAWEQMPSERNHRFGMFWQDSLERNIRLGNVTKVVFIAVIVSIFAFVILIPVVKYTSRSQVPLPYQEISNNSGEVTNCWSNVLSFGYDCSENTTEKKITEFISLDSNTSKLNTIHDKSIDANDSSAEDTQSKTYLSEVDLSSVETQELNSVRVGRSKWPYMSMTYPYLNVAKPKPTPTVSQKEISTMQTNIFAIPMDMSNDEFSKPRKTPSTYVITPLTSFSNSYAQLLPYKYPRNNTNFEWVLKYLRENMETNMQQRSDNPENVMESKSSVVKVSGNYIMPLNRRRPGEIIVSGSGNSKPDNKLFNGHAYDPFLKFRPDNLLEINRLIPVKTGIDFGPRFRRPVSFVPKPSLDEDLIHPYYSRYQEPRGSGSHTVAIFHPPEVKPPLIKRPPMQPASEKPFSVTLDIFPVTMDDETVTESVPYPVPTRNLGRPNPKFKSRPNERPRWRPQTPGSTPRKPPGGRPTFPGSDNHMVVHLNLYPSKRKPYTYFRELERNASLMALLSGGQFQERDSSDDHVNYKRSKPKTNVTSIPDVAEESVLGNYQPEFSALKNQQRSGKRKENPSNITRETDSQNSPSNTSSPVSLYELTNGSDKPSRNLNESTVIKEKLTMNPNESTVVTKNYSNYLYNSTFTAENFFKNLSDSITTTEDLPNGLGEPTSLPENLSTMLDDSILPSEDLYQIFGDSTTSTEDLHIYMEGMTTQFSTNI